MVFTDLETASFGFVLGHGDGGFTAGKSYQTGAEMFGASAADINGDGVPDLVAQGYNRQEDGGVAVTVYWVMGLGNGAFTGIPRPDGGTYPTGVLPIPDADPSGASAIEQGTSISLSLAVGDFNNDGFDDVACPVLNCQVEVFNGEADGGMVFFQASNAGASPQCGALFAASGTFGTNGLTDLAVSDNDPFYAAIAVLSNQGGAEGLGPDATVFPTLYSAGGTPNNKTQPFGITTGYVNADPFPDLLVSDQDSNELTLLYNTQGSGFSGPNLFHTDPNSPLGVAIGDVDGDGNGDVIGISPKPGESGGTLYLFLNHGPVGFTLETYVTGLGSLAVASGDFNEDGRADIITGQIGGFEVWLGQP